MTSTLRGGHRDGLGSGQGGLLRPRERICPSNSAKRTHDWILIGVGKGGEASWVSFRKITLSAGGEWNDGLEDEVARLVGRNGDKNTVTVLARVLRA